uniref:NADH dehydrogenase [ubiquinone] 1 alpha subcomplex subunit 12 n=1 Tax=Oryza rufipogon TaxID=4529 RepID=A0A0E0PQI2_ORYRU
MSKQLVSRLLGMFRSRTQVGADKFGNRYFTRVEEVDGVMEEKRWVEFKGSDQDQTTVQVEWICWLNGQRKKAPTPEELAELEARRERVKQNIESHKFSFADVAVVYSKKKEEEEKKTGVRPVKTVGKFESPNLKSSIPQFPDTSLDQRKGHDEVSRSKDGSDTEDATVDTDRNWCYLQTGDMAATNMNDNEHIILAVRKARSLIGLAAGDGSNVRFSEAAVSDTE